MQVLFPLHLRNTGQHVVDWRKSIPQVTGAGRGLNYA